MIDDDWSDTTRWQFPGVLRTLGLVHGELRVRHGLSLHDYLILGALAEAASGSVPVAKLAAFLQESGDRMSYLLRGLQAAGLIDRHRRAGDRRTVEATLTDAGRSRFAAAETTAKALMRQHLGPGLDTQEPAGRSCDVT